MSSKKVVQNFQEKFCPPPLRENLCVREKDVYKRQALNRAVDVLNEVRRVDDRPLRFCLVREAKKPHEQR